MLTVIVPELRSKKTPVTSSNELPLARLSFFLVDLNDDTASQPVDAWITG